MTPEAIFDHLENRGHDPNGDSPHLMSVYSQKSPQWWGLTSTHTPHTHTTHTHTTHTTTLHHTHTPQHTHTPPPHTTHTTHTPHTEMSGSGIRWAICKSAYGTTQHTHHTHSHHTHTHNTTHTPHTQTDV